MSFNNTPEETLSTCVHGAPVKMVCLVCIEESSLNMLSPPALSKRLSELEVKVSYNNSWMETLKNNFTPSILLEENINNLHKRIDQLDTVYADRMLDLEKRINNLEKHKDNVFLEEVIKSSANTFLSIVRLEEKVKTITECKEKTPHKCPVCSGYGDVYTDSISMGVKIMEGWVSTPDGMLKKKCNGCEGNGVVWG